MSSSSASQRVHVRRRASEDFGASRSVALATPFDQREEGQGVRDIGPSLAGSFCAVSTPISAVQCLLEGVCRDLQILPISQISNKSSVRQRIMPKLDGYVS